ncbi:MAG: DUF5723 family protein [Paludibacter sp.]
MIKYIYKGLFFLLMLSSFATTIRAQHVNTLYFMDNVPVRHTLNPAFLPQNELYISLPIIGFSQLNFENNSLTIKDLIYNYNGQTVSFLHPEGGSIDKFYSLLKSPFTAHTYLETNLLSIGFYYKKTFYSFALSEKLDGNVVLPKDLFGFILYGTANKQSNIFDFSSLQANATLYTEAAFGVGKQVNENLSLGFKFKFLIGSSNISNSNSNFNLEVGAEKWSVKNTGLTNISSQLQLIDLQRIYSSGKVTFPEDISKLITPSGLGLGVDFGIEYKLNSNVKLSGSITDLGFISWNKNTINYNYGINQFNFNGLGQFDSNNNFSNFISSYNRLVTGNQFADSLSSALKANSYIKKTTNSYSTSTTAKLNLGFEYSLVNNHLSFGILSRSYLSNSKMIGEFTTSLNAKPYEWLNASVSYSILGTQINSFGAGLGLRTGYLHWFFAADYIPFQKTTFSLSKIYSGFPNTNISLPYNLSRFNFAFGVNLVFNKTKESIGLHGKKLIPDCRCNFN